MVNWKVIQAARKFLRFTKDTVTVGSVKEYLRQMGVTIAEIDTSKLDTINALNALSYFIKYTAVTRERKDGFVTLINRSMPEHDKFRALIREAGHIILKHRTTDTLLGVDVQDQKEADTFADLVQNPSKLRFYRLLWAASLTLSTIIITVGICAFYVSPPVKPVSVATGAPKTEEHKTEEYKTEAFVYVTKNGDKYHTERCKHVHGRELIPLAQNKAEEMRYTPCADCMQ